MSTDETKQGMVEHGTSEGGQSVVPVDELAEQRVNRGKVGEFKLVSGLTLLARKFTLGDEDVWSDEVQMRKGIGVILDRIVQDVVDPVFYEEMGVIKRVGDMWRIDWTKILSGDRVDLLMSNRVRTYGPEYSFLWKCPQCEATRWIDVNLEDMMKIKQFLPDDSRHIFTKGDPFVFHLPDEDVDIEFDLQVGRHEKVVMDMQRSGQLEQGRQSLSLMPRIRKIEGVHDAKKKHFLQKEMTSDDAGSLRDEMERVDCGIDTAMVVDCRACNYVGETDLPFGRGFLSPQKGIQKRRRKQWEQEQNEQSGR